MIDRLERDPEAHDKLQAALARCERAETRMGQLQAQLSDVLTVESVPPPCDALAERIVLRGLLLKPEQLASYDPTMLLVYPEHRVMHACMKRAYAGTHGQPWTAFYLRWVDECERAKPGLWRLLDNIGEDEARLTNGRPRQDWLWWWQRLKDCAEARRLVTVAQNMAASAWRGDIDAARQIAAKATPRAAASIRVEV